MPQDAIRRGRGEVPDSWSPFERLKRVFNLRRLRERLGLSRDVAAIIRFELDMTLLNLHNRLSLRYHKSIRLLKQSKQLRLNIGCGEDVLPGWVNMDCYARTLGSQGVLLADVRKGLPLATESASVIFCDHFLEHLYHEHARQLLKEFYRVLEPGGAARIIVPDGRKILQAYFDEEAPIRAHWSWVAERGLWIEAVNTLGGTGHHYLYDEEVLLADLEEAGFRKVSVAKCGNSGHPEMAEDRADEDRKVLSLYVEAEKESP